MMAALSVKHVEHTLAHLLGKSASVKTVLLLTQSLTVERRPLNQINDHVPQLVKSVSPVEALVPTTHSLLQVVIR